MVTIKRQKKGNVRATTDQKEMLSKEKKKTLSSRRYL